MDGSGSEQREDHPKKIEIVTLGQEFKLFDPHQTINTTDLSTPAMDRDLILRMNSLPDLHFQFCLASHEPSRGLPIATVYPFEPEKGYLITNADYNSDSATKKLEDIIEGKSPKPSIPNDAIELFVYAPSVWRNAKIYDASRDGFRPEVLEVLKKLRLKLIFPNSEFQGIPHLGGGVVFDEFYPIDSGPMPELRSYYSSGRPIAFPANQEYLETVKGMFVFDPKTE